MDSITISSDQARVFDAGDERAWKHEVLPALAAQAALLPGEATAVEVYHPEGFLIALIPGPARAAAR